MEFAKSDPCLLESIHIVYILLEPRMTCESVGSRTWVFTASVKKPDLVKIIGIGKKVKQFVSRTNLSWFC